jgi:thiamine phosphate synthase YjbQ (UPF0047 family)
MLKNTFCHIQRIGTITEEKLWDAGIQVIIRNGKLWSGTWQGIYFCEFDGPRQREIYLAFTG